MGQPAHDEFVAADKLLAVNAQVLAFGQRAFGNDQAPGNQGGYIARPAGLDGQAVKVNVIALKNDFLAGGVTMHFRSHVPKCGFQHGDLAKSIFQAFGCLGLTQGGQ